jgi:hypothetical protein
LFGSEATACYLLSIKQLLASKKKNNKTVAGLKEEKKQHHCLRWHGSRILLQSQSYGLTHYHTKLTP